MHVRKSETAEMVNKTLETLNWLMEMRRSGFMVISFKVWNMRQMAETKAVNAKKAVSLSVRGSLFAEPRRKSVLISGIVEIVTRNNDTLRSSFRLLSLLAVLLAPFCTRNAGSLVKLDG